MTQSDVVAESKVLAGKEHRKQARPQNIDRLKQDVTAYKLADAVITPKFNICGLVLKPFCLGHFLVLEHYSSPFMLRAETDITDADYLYWLFHALIVCAHSYEDNLKLIDDSKAFQKICNVFSKNLKKQMKHDPEWNYIKAKNVWQQYIDYYFHVPRYDESDDSKSPHISGMDWKQDLMLVFKKLGYSDTDIFNTNFRELFLKWCSYMQSEGAIQVANKAQIQMLERGTARATFTPNPKRD